VEFDDELGEEQRQAPLLPAPDRLWRHPSEVALERPVASRSHQPRLWTVAVLAGTIGALLATGVEVAVSKPHTKIQTVDVPAVERQADPVTMVTLIGTSIEPLDVVAITQRVRPAVVELQGQNSAGTLTSRGSAVMFRSDGYMLTDAGVVAGAITLTAVLADTRCVPARVLGTDPASGVALVKIAGSGYPVAALGSTAGVQVGQSAIAIGGAPQSIPAVVVGTVRAIGRSIDDGQGRQLVGMIETDATPTYGAWGGALVDENGVVIGITAGLQPSTDPAVLATPIELAYAVASQLMDGGTVAYGWLGIDGRDLPAASAKSLGLVGGALVERVTTAGPADAGGLQPGDIITAIDNRAVTSMASVMLALRTHRPGDRVFLHVRRAGGTRTFTAVLGQLPTS
jgi:S1-C subfamily serine protease